MTEWVEVVMAPDRRVVEAFGLDGGRGERRFLYSCQLEATTETPRCVRWVWGRRFLYSYQLSEVGYQLKTRTEV